MKEKPKKLPKKLKGIIILSFGKPVLIEAYTEGKQYNLMAGRDEIYPCTITYSAPTRIRG